MKYLRYIGAALVAVLLLAGSVTINSDSSAMLPKRMMMGAAGVSGGNDSYTVLLAHMDGTDDAQVFTDSGAGPNCPHTITANGNVKTENTQKKFGTTSAYFDGTGDYLTVGDHADWDFDTGDWCLEAWIYPTAISGDGHNFAISLGTQSPSRATLGFTATQMKCYLIASDSTVIFNTTYGSGLSILNNWNHFAMCRYGNSAYLYFNGVEIASASVTGKDFDFTGITPSIGVLTGTAFYYHTGYIDELRISKGIARWTANFTPPTKAYY